MPTYQVTISRFYNGTLCGPGTKRPTIHRAKAFPKGKVPEGLVLLKETAAKARATATKAKKAAEKDKEKEAADKIEKDAATFIQPPAAVQTV